MYVEDATIRDPEWVEMEQSPPMPGEGRRFFWDPIHGYVKVEGPVVVVSRGPIHPY